MIRVIKHVSVSNLIPVKSIIMFSVKQFPTPYKHRFGIN